MPEPTFLRVTGTAQARGDGILLVLDGRLEGHDTFLAAHLDLDNGPSVRVRIITLDEMTVLRPAGPTRLAPGRWSGSLRLRHGLRPVAIPSDLADSAIRQGRAPAPWTRRKPGMPSRSSARRPARVSVPPGWTQSYARSRRRHEHRHQPHHRRCRRHTRRRGRTGPFHEASGCICATRLTSQGHHARSAAHTTEDHSRDHR
jgi:hypothetical protein